jgi:hypothetical protein
MHTCIGNDKEVLLKYPRLKSNCKKFTDELDACLNGGEKCSSDICGNSQYTDTKNCKKFAASEFDKQVKIEADKYTYSPFGKFDKKASEAFLTKTEKSKKTAVDAVTATKAKQAAAKCSATVQPTVACLTLA